MTRGAERLTYEIRVRGEVPEALVAALAALNLNIEQTANGAILVGVFREQAELHGALQAMQDFGVELVEVRQRSRWTSDNDPPNMRTGASWGYCRADSRRNVVGKAPRRWPSGGRTAISQSGVITRRRLLQLRRT